MKVLALLLLAVVAVSATRGNLGPPEFETQPLASNTLPNLQQAQDILGATQPRDFSFEKSNSAPKEALALMDEYVQERPQEQAPVYVEEAATVKMAARQELHHGLSHHLTIMDGQKLHTRESMGVHRTYLKVGNAFVQQFIAEYVSAHPDEYDMDSFVEEGDEVQVEASNVDHGDAGTMSDRESRRQWRKMHRNRGAESDQRFSPSRSRRERGRVPSEAARDMGMPVMLEESATRGQVMDEEKLMSYDPATAARLADSAPEQAQADPDAVDHDADTESLAGGLTPVKLHNSEVDVDAAPRTVESPRFQEVHDQAQTGVRTKGFFKKLWNGAKKLGNKIMTTLGLKKKKPAPAPAKAAPAQPAPKKKKDDPAALEDCVGCRMVWKQVELDVGNARYIEDIQASFEHNCMDAQKSTIFYAVCEDMYDDMYALTDDYMSNKYQVRDMCKRGKYCLA